MQLVYSCIVATWVTYLQNRHRKDSKTIVGASMWTAAYWLKSAIIAAAIVYGPERNHWVMLYAILAAGIYAIGDVGLLFLSSPRKWNAVP